MGSPSGDQYSSHTIAPASPAANPYFGPDPAAGAAETPAGSSPTPPCLQALSADYLRLFSAAAGGPFADVTFCVDGRQIHAHKCILAARSAFFRLLFCSSSSSSTSSTCAYSSEAAVPHPQYASLGCTSASLAPALADHHHLGRSIHLTLQALAPDPHLPPFLDPGPPGPLSPSCASATATAHRSIIPIDVVRHDAFVAVLQYLYCGQLILEPLLPNSAAVAACTLRGCPHTHCPFAVDLCLETVHAARFFGIDQLLDLLQRRLVCIAEHVSVESLMRMLLVAKKQKLHQLWSACSEMVMNSGLGSHVLRRYLPTDVLHELAHSRLQRGYPGATINNYEMINVVPSYNPNVACSNDEHRILRLQQALDCMDVELVRLMVMGEGLNLDRANALHYSVANCSREVVKALLELGVVDVNCADGTGRTALHLAAEMGSADMIAVLLDHHADPNAQTADGLTALDIVKCLINNKANHQQQQQQQHNHHPSGESLGNNVVAAPPPPPPILCTKSDQKRIHLCIELLQSAAAVVNREEAECSSCVTSLINTSKRTREEIMAETQVHAADHRRSSSSTSNNLHLKLHNSPSRDTNPRTSQPTNFYCLDQQTNYGSFFYPSMDQNPSLDVNNYTANSTSLSS